MDEREGKGEGVKVRRKEREEGKGEGKKVGIENDL